MSIFSFCKVPWSSGADRRIQNVQLRLQTLPPPRGLQAFPLVISSAPQAPTLALDQIVSVRTLINSCLDIVDVSTWTGDAKNAGFISGQLLLLEEHICEAKGFLKGGTDVQKPWWEDPLDEDVSITRTSTTASLVWRI